MDPTLEEPECSQSASEQTIESQNINILESDEKFIKSEVYDDPVIEIKSPEALTISSSFIIEQKTNKKGSKKCQNVKNRQQAAMTSALERPKTAREKTKINVKSTLKPHMLGTIPPYLAKRKENSSKKSSFVEIERPSTSDFPMDDMTAKSKTTQGEQGDIKASSTFTNVSETNENDKLKMKISNLRQQIAEMKKSHELLEKKYEDSYSAHEKTKGELKTSLGRVKSLEIKSSRNQNDQNKFEEKTGHLEVQIANLIQQNQELSEKLKKKIDENRKLETLVEKLRNEMMAKNNSFETLIAENNHLQALFGYKKTEDEKESEALLTNEMQILTTDNDSLKNELAQKSVEICSLKEDKHNLINEIKHLNNLLEISSQKIKSLNDNSENFSLDNEVENLQQKIHELTKTEKELNQKILTLTSKLDDEKNINIRNNTLLEFRADYIKTLQDADSVNKSRLILHAKELDDVRKQLKSFEKFKASHAEEKQNFKRLLKNMESENTRLKAKVEVYEKESVRRRN